ncbi:ABC-type nitrate/sulfonate/bicarbonate transport system, periplasmic component [Cylindrospermum stagnale PCC 7417]|uniref:ABC-type nitrate/sulfonate/bicarbonate transport system, periplasmic component n=1 Tax=Cylindrospermum stagnale PCC 7417 TaxID=56107 RepID=K9X113_9NOST|nr:ABC-type nitrate/sulfonate/bicarbonate transport system, periplasmic component [Cylindrospermum stagnale PCC 7417]
MIYFPFQQKLAKKSQKQTRASVKISSGNCLEKVNLEIGFIALTDATPLIIAKEKGFFAEYGLEVNLSWEPCWKEIAKGVASGRLDAAQMVAGMPLYLTLGAGGKTPVPIVTALTLSRNGNAITFSKRLFDAGVRNLADLYFALNTYLGKNLSLGIVHPASMHNLLLRYWLAAGGINPDKDISLVVIPPPQMLASLKAMNIDGYCVGEPWNSRAVHEDLGFAIATTPEIWSGHPEKVLGVREDWAEKYPQTHLALVKALLAAGEYCDDLRNREEILQLICHPRYLGTDPTYTRPGFIDLYPRGDGKEPQLLTAYNQFYHHQANYPHRDEMLWILTQLARWGLVAFPKNWVEVIKRVCRSDIFEQAAREIGCSHTRMNGSIKLFDGKKFDPSQPIEYLSSLEVKQQIRFEELFI